MTDDPGVGTEAGDEMGSAGRRMRTRVVAGPVAAVLATLLALGVTGLTPAAADPTPSSTTATGRATPADPAAPDSAAADPSVSLSTSGSAPAVPPSAAPSVSTGSTTPVPSMPTPGAPTTDTGTSAPDSGGPTDVPTDVPAAEPTSTAPVPTPQPTIGWTVSALAVDPSPATPEEADQPVTVRTVCGALLVANPDATRSVVLAWGDFGRSAPEHVVTVPAGAAARVAVDRVLVDWAAGWVGSDDGLGTAGRGETVAVDQNCGTSAAALRAVVSAPCAARRAPASVVVVGAGARADLSFWVTRRGDAVTVADGVVLSDRPTPVDLAAAGAGDYVLTLAQDRQIVDEAAFQVLDCLTTTPDCRALTWTNPAGNAAVTLSFRDGGAAQAVRLSAGESVRVPVTSGAVRWSASAESADGVRLSDAGSDATPAGTDGCDVTQAAAGAPAAPGTDTATSGTGAAAAAAGVAVSATGAPITTPARPAAPNPVQVDWWPAILAAVVLLGAGLVARRRR